MSVDYYKKYMKYKTKYMKLKGSGLMRSFPVNILVIAFNITSIDDINRSNSNIFISNVDNYKIFKKIENEIMNNDIINKYEVISINKDKKGIYSYVYKNTTIRIWVLEPGSNELMIRFDEDSINEVADYHESPDIIKTNLSRTFNLYNKDDITTIFEPFNSSYLRDRFYKTAVETYYNSIFDKLLNIRDEIIPEDSINETDFIKFIEKYGYSISLDNPAYIKILDKYKISLHNPEYAYIELYINPSENIRIIRELGSGTYGAVFLVDKMEDTGIAKKYALKLWKKTEPISSMYHEIDCMEKIRDFCDKTSPYYDETLTCTTKIIDLRKSESFIFYDKGMLIEYLDNYKSIYDYYTKKVDKTYNEDEVSQIIRGLARINSKLANKSIVHNDLSMNNILIKVEDGKVNLRLIDFGLCRAGIKSDVFEKLIKRTIFKYTVEEGNEGRIYKLITEIYTLINPVDISLTDFIDKYIAIFVEEWNKY